MFVHPLTNQRLHGAQQIRFISIHPLVEYWIESAGYRALEHGFELWERECRRMASAPEGAATQGASDPMAAWAENWRKATEAFSGSTGGWSEEARKQAETVQKTLQDGMRAWQRLWEPQK